MPKVKLNNKNNLEDKGDNSKRLKFMKLVYDKEG